MDEERLVTALVAPQILFRHGVKNDLGEPVKPRIVRRWAQRGRLRGYRVEGSQRAPWVFSRRDLKEFAEEYVKDHGKEAAKAS